MEENAPVLLSGTVILLLSHFKMRCRILTNKQSGVFTEPNPAFNEFVITFDPAQIILT